MTLVTKKINGKEYYYSFLSYFLVSKSKSFSKYIGTAKPAKNRVKEIENAFKGEIIRRLSGKNYLAEFISEDDVVKTLLFRDTFEKKYFELTELKKRKYDIDSTIQFTLTTLTTEEVDVDLEDVRKAFEKGHRFTQREQISRNMLDAVESIKKPHALGKAYLLELHKRIMAGFEIKTPGIFRERQVYLHRIEERGISEGSEISYRPPDYRKISTLLDEFTGWYNSSNLNPVEKAALAHYKLYKIHPFLDGNKRMCRLAFNKTLLDNKFPLINISFEKEAYFDALVEAVEKDKPKVFVSFALKQYYAQVRKFLIQKQ